VLRPCLDQTTALIMLTPYIVLMLLGGGDGALSRSDGVDAALAMVGLEIISIPNWVEADAPLFRTPGWGEHNGRVSPDVSGLRCTMRALPQLRKTWPALGPVTDSSGDERWQQRVDSSNLRFVPELLVEPPTLDLHPDQGSMIASGEVWLSRRSEPLLVNVEMGCGFSVVDDMPLLVGSTPVRCRIEFDMHYSLSPERVSVLVQVSHGDLLPIPIRWADPRPHQASLQPEVIDTTIGHPKSTLCVASAEHPISVVVPQSNVDRNVTVHAISPWQHEISVTPRTPAGYSPLPVDVIGPQGKEQILLYIVPPWPAVLETGQRALGCAVIPGEQVLIVEDVDGPGLCAVFPDRFPGIEHLIANDRLVGRERVPTLATGTLRLKRDRYAISMSVDPNKSKMSPRWAKEWR
jgi:hypothetical protein